ncbi:MAG TPA: hypothetical protein VN363_06110 [Anaerolineales bacterium]|nr:hypothetical protein [Anaerolineales bacterium]
MSLPLPRVVIIRAGFASLSAVLGHSARSSCPGRRAARRLAGVAGGAALLVNWLPQPPAGDDQLGLGLFIYERAVRLINSQSTIDLDQMPSPPDPNSPG